MTKEGSIAWWRNFIKTFEFNTRQDERDFYGMYRGWSDESGATNRPKRYIERAEKIANMFWEKMKELGWDI